MWPAKVDRVVKDAGGRTKVAIKYYELKQEAASTFRLETSKIEFFFRPPYEHFKFKVIYSRES
jgi:hypothetical protein